MKKLILLFVAHIAALAFLQHHCIRLQSMNQQKSCKIFHQNFPEVTNHSIYPIWETITWCISVMKKKNTSCQYLL